MDAPYISYDRTHSNKHFPSEYVRYCNSSAGNDTGNRQRATSRPPEVQPPSARKARSRTEESAPESSVLMTAVSSSISVETDSVPISRIRFEGEVKADAPSRVVPSSMPAPEPSPASSSAGELPDLRDFIRSRRAALASFMEQGASLKIDGDLLTVTPRSDIYVRYLTDNRNVIGELASELYGRRIKVEMAGGGAAGIAISERLESPNGAAADSSPAEASPADAPGVKALAEGAASEGAPVSSTSAGSLARQTPSDARQKLYADPLVRRIFEEFDARLVELKTTSIRPDASAPSVSKK